jgi:hypothetical protein
MWELLLVLIRDWVSTFLELMRLFGGFFIGQPNSISTASALRLPTSKAIGNY